MRMSRRIAIVLGGLEVDAELNDSRTAALIWDQLPLESRYNTWGDEIYFAVPVEAELEDGQAVVEPGDLGYWPQGNAFCIFYGKTPASRGDEIRPASPVNVIGKVISNPKVFKKAARAGHTIRIEKRGQ
jgi:hypothetical protein